MQALKELVFTSRVRGGGAPRKIGWNGWPKTINLRDKVSYMSLKVNQYFNGPLPQWGFPGPMKLNDEANNANQHNVVENPNWQEEDQLAIYKHHRGVELGYTKKQLFHTFY